jgi:hypothetical protein
VPGCETSSILSVKQDEVKNGIPIQWSSGLADAGRNLKSRDWHSSWGRGARHLLNSPSIGSFTGLHEPPFCASPEGNPVRPGHYAFLATSTFLRAS